MLLVIAWFVWSGAGREAAMVRQRRSFGWPMGSQPAGVIHEPEVVWSAPSDRWGSDARLRRRYYRVGPWLVSRDEWVTGDDGNR